MFGIRGMPILLFSQSDKVLRGRLGIDSRLGLYYSLYFHLIFLVIPVRHLYHALFNCSLISHSLLACCASKAAEILPEVL